MLQHSKSVVSMTFVCLGIAKLECQISLGISFLCLICPYMICLKEKYAKKNQKQKDQKCFKKLLQWCILGDVGVIRCTLNVIVSIKQL